MKLRSIVPVAFASCILLMVFLGSQTSQDDLDFNALAARLVERGAASTQGSIHYRNFSFLINEAEYAELRALIVNSQQRDKGDVSLRASITTMLSSDAVEPLRGFTGAIFFKGDRQRLLRTVDESFDTERERIEQIAAELGVHAAIDDVWTEDAAYDGESLKILRNDERLIYPERQEGPLFQLMQFDISLAPWEVAIEKGANIDGQVISVTPHSGRYRITYTNHGGTDRMSAGSYEFDPQLGFAPIWLGLVSRGSLQFEILFGYERLEQATLLRPSVTSHARFESDGRVRMNVWLLDEWSEEVSDSDLEIDLPTRVLVMDRRVGAAEPRVYLRDLGLDVAQAGQNRAKTAGMGVEEIRMLLDDWGEAESELDLNGDGVVDGLDLIILLENWE